MLMKQFSHFFDEQNCGIRGFPFAANAKLNLSIVSLCKAPYSVARCSGGWLVMLFPYSETGPC